MSELRRGWVIDVDLEPTKGSETGKVRPCVVVTNNVHNERVPVIQVVPLTEWTDKKGKIGTNVRVEPSAINGLIDTPLPKGERILPSKSQLALAGIPPTKVEVDSPEALLALNAKVAVCPTVPRKRGNQSVLAFTTAQPLGRLPLQAKTA